jgi:hypothetical protein
MKKESSAKTAKSTGKKDVADPYNRFKIFQGQQYTGMAVGRSHKWYYDKGTWIDKKITPEKWLINFEVAKRRAGKAPEGSGVPVGTEYHWYILAHQLVKKEDANTYSTAMNGLKFKLAHRRADKDTWNSSDKAQRKHLIKILKGFIEELENEPLEEFVAGEENMTRTKKQLLADAKKKAKEQEKISSTAKTARKSKPVKQNRTAAPAKKSVSRKKAVVKKR